MRATVWILLGALGTLVAAACASRLHVAHLLPNVALVVVVFLAMRRRIAEVSLVALALGYLVGAQALAPVGLHELALVAVGLGAGVVGGSLRATGKNYVACVSGLGDVAYHVLLLLLLMSQDRPVGFSSWPAALLVPQAALTAALAWALHPALHRLDLALTPRGPVGLSWR